MDSPLVLNNVYSAGDSLQLLSVLQPDWQSSVDGRSRGQRKSERRFTENESSTRYVCRSDSDRERPLPPTIWTDGVVENVPATHTPVTGRVNR